MVRRQVAAVPAARLRPLVVAMALHAVRALVCRGAEERAPRLPVADAAAGDRN